MLEVQYDNLLSSVETLASGSIPAFLLPLNVLGNTLSSVQAMLDHDFLGFHLVYTDLNYKYHSADFSYTRRRPKDIFITIKFPTSFLRVFHYYRVHTVPCPIHNNISHDTKQPHSHLRHFKQQPAILRNLWRRNVAYTTHGSSWPQNLYGQKS